MEIKPSYIPIEFKFPVIDQKDKRVVSSFPDIIILHEKYLEFKWKATVEEDFLQKEYIGQQNIMKHHFISVSACFSHHSETFQCNMWTQTEEASIAISFTTLAEAISLKEKIWNWLLQ